MFHAEVVRRNGKPVGYVRAASYGFTLGGAVGLAMIEAGEPVDQAYLDAGEWEVEIAGSRLPGRGVAAAAVRPGEQAHPALRALAVPTLRAGLRSTG